MKHKSPVIERELGVKNFEQMNLAIARNNIVFVQSLGEVYMFLEEISNKSKNKGNAVDCPRN